MISGKNFFENNEYITKAKKRNWLTNILVIYSLMNKIDFHINDYLIYIFWTLKSIFILMVTKSLIQFLKNIL